MNIFRIKKFIIYLLTLNVLTLLTACSGTYKTKLDFNPGEPLRIAVLPFVVKDSEGKIVNEEGRLLVDNLSLISSAVEETPAQTVRKQTTAELKKTSLDLVSGTLIDIDLPHHGYARADGTLDLERVWLTPPSQLCSSFLSCDAILYGTVTRWDRSYYGLESVNTVGIEIKIVSAKNGAILFSSEARDSESRGISKIPTGISSIFLEPIKGLDSDIITNLSSTVVKKMLQPLIVANRPHYVDSSPPAIYASSHDGANRKISEQQPLVIVLFGSEGAQASFSIGNVIESVPMLERSPGHFYGEYLPIKTDSFKDQEVTVTLQDAVGRKSTSKTPGGLVSYP